MSMPARDSVYEIYQQHFNSFDEGIKALNSQCKTLKRICEDYPRVIFVMGLSEHDGKRAKKVNVNAGKRGRPKYEFVPQSNKYEDSFKTGVHIHAYIGGLYAATVATKFADVQNELYHKKQHEQYVEKYAVMAIRRKDGSFPLGYVERQSSRMRYSDKQMVLEYVEKNKDRQQNFFSRRTDKLKDFDPFEGIG